MNPNMILIAAGAAAGLYAMAAIFGKKAAGTAGEAAAKFVFDAAKAAAKEYGNIILDGLQVPSLLAMMAAERIEDFYQFDQAMEKDVIPGRCSDVHRIVAKVKDTGLLMMDDLRYLVAFLREHNEVGVPRGWITAYDSNAVTAAIQMIATAKAGGVPTAYNIDVAVKVLADKAVETGTITGRDYVYIQSSANYAAGRRKSPNIKPWDLSMSDEGLKNALAFMDQVNAGTIKVL
jgi:hypothetical protein